MMTFFPVPYEDELLYSVLGRYHIRSGNTSIKATLKDILGKTTITAVVDLPAHIDRIIDSMPIGNQYTSDDLIDKHTLYPFYSAFLPKEQAETIKEYMKGDKGGNIYNKIGLMASSISLNQYFKFCPECLKEDMKQYGELYWHRIHQIPCVLVCPVHEALLYDSQVPNSGFNKHEYRIASPEVCRVYNSIKMYPDRTLEQLVNLARDVKVLLEYQFSKLSLEWFREQYMNKLKEYGYANINSRVKRQNLIKDFVDYYGDNLLEILQVSIDIHNDHNWLLDMIRKKDKTNHPIRHLLLARFLNISIEDLFHKKLQYRAFGNGLWTCLNPAAGHYKEKVINDVEIKYGNDSKSPLGIFNCSCGFSYMRTGPDTKEEDEYVITKIITYGPVWEAKLKTLTEERLSLRETARQLQVDPATVKKYAKKLNLKTYWEKRTQISNEQEEKIENKASEDDKKEDYRLKWLDLQKQYPNRSKTQLSQMAQGVFTWLYRKDMKWLNQNSPELKPTTNKNLRVNWKQRDEEILIKIKQVVNKMLNAEDKPKRITIGAVGNELGIKSLLEKHIDKLPKVRHYLQENTESIRDYQIRRIKWAINELEMEGQNLTSWRIYRKAGIRQEYINDLEREMRKLIVRCRDN